MFRSVQAAPVVLGGLLPNTGRPWGRTTQGGEASTGPAGARIQNFPAGPFTTSNGESVSGAPTTFSLPSPPRFLGRRQRAVAFFDRDLAGIGNLTPTGAAFDVLTWSIRCFTWFLKSHFCSPCCSELCGTLVGVPLTYPSRPWRRRSVTRGAPELSSGKILPRTGDRGEHRAKRQRGTDSPPAKWSVPIAARRARRRAAQVCPGIRLRRTLPHTGLPALRRTPKCRAHR